MSDDPAACLSVPGRAGLRAPTGRSTRAGLAARASLAAAVLAALLSPALTGGARAAEFVAQHLFVCSEGGDAVLELDASGALVRSIGAGSGLSAPTGLAFDAQGVLWVASSGSNRLLGFAADGLVVAEIGAGSGLVAPRGLAVGPTGELFTCDPGSGTVFRFQRDGTQLGSIGAGAGLLVPSDLAFGADGHLFVANAGSGRVTEFDATGALVRELGAGTSLGLAISLCFAPDGRLLVSSGSGASVVALDSAGAEVAAYDAGGSLHDTAGVAIGPDGLLYVVSRSSSAVSVLDASGQLVRELGNDAGLLLGSDIAFAPSRFAVTLSGRLQRPGVPETKFKQAGVLSVMPGSLAVGLALADDNGLAELLGSRSLLLRGFQGDALDDKALVLQGALSLGSGNATQHAEVLLTGTGKTDVLSVYTPLKFKGDVWASGPGGQAYAALKVGKLIQ